MRVLPLLALLAGLSGCVAYPKVYDVTKKGTAALDGGKPVVIKASLIKSCDTMKGASEKVIRTEETTTDAQGRYKITVRGVAWNTKSFLTDAGCESRVQMFVCRDICRPEDDIDINVLGK